MEIRFYYETDEPYGCFSNFSGHKIRLLGKTWPTTEHFYQAQKFSGTELEEVVRTADTPWNSKQFARTYKRKWAPNWNALKDDVMYEAVKAKFEQHVDIREILLGTGEARLVEDSPRDYYWGCGKDGSGVNMLGQILMKVREELRSNETS